MNEVSAFCCFAWDFDDSGLIEREELNFVVEHG